MVHHLFAVFCSEIGLTISWTTERTRDFPFLFFSRMTTTCGLPGAAEMGARSRAAASSRGPWPTQLRQKAGRLESVEISRFRRMFPNRAGQSREALAAPGENATSPGRVGPPSGPGMSPTVMFSRFPVCLPRANAGISRRVEGLSLWLLGFFFLTFNF